MKKLIFVVACALFLMTGFASAEEADAVLGQWYTDAEKKDVVVEFYKDNDLYSGKVVWLKNPNEDDGTPKVDDENPDEARRNDPILGMNLVKGFSYKGKISWPAATTMIPTTAKTINVKCL